MSLTWQDITETDNFSSLDEKGRETVRTSFYEGQIRSKLDKKDHLAAANLFFSSTMDDVYSLGQYKVSDAIPEILGSKGVGAFLVGMGAGMRDTYDGLRQLFGVGEKQLDKDREAFRALRNDPEYGGLVSGGQITGFVAEPIGFLIPGMKGKNLFQAARMGAGIGAGFGAVGYVDEGEGQTRATNVLLGMAVGGVLGPALYGIGRGISKYADKIETRAADSILNGLNSKIQYFEQHGATQSLAVRAAKRFYSLTDDDLNAVMAKSAMAKFDNPDINVVQKIEARLSNSLNPKQLAKEVKMSTTGIFGKIMTPVVSTVTRIDPVIGGAMRKMEYKAHQEVAKAFNIINPFNDLYKKLPDNIKKEIKSPLLSGDFQKVNYIFSKQKNADELTQGFAAIQRMLRDVHTRLRESGYNIPELENYWPRMVTDKEGIINSNHSVIRKAIARAEKDKGRPLSFTEQNKVIESLYAPGKQEKIWGSTSGSLRKRSVGSLDDDLVKYYGDPMDTLNHYIHQNLKDINRRLFFKHLGFKGEPSIDGSDLNDSISSIINKARARGALSPEQENELIEILTARFGKGEEAPHIIIQRAKNMIYAITLGNPLSAMTQFGDLVFASQKFGIYNTVTAVFQKKLLKKESIGLMDAIEEFASDKDVMKNISDWAFRWGGFNAVDRLGKETFINTALKHYNKLSLTEKGRAKIHKQWDNVYGKVEADDLIQALQKKNVSNDNLKLLMWNELSDVQPISLSEMPLKYLQHPNGRVAYTLKTFTIKQLDFMRKQIVDEYASGNKKVAFMNAAKFTMLFVAANSTIDAAKDVLKGKAISIEDHVVDNVWALVGASKFTFDEASREGIGSAALNFVAPPVNVFDDITRGFDDPKRWWNLVPVVGKLAKHWTEDERDQYFNFTNTGKAEFLEGMDKDWKL